MRTALWAALLVWAFSAQASDSPAGLPFLHLSSGARGASLGEATAALLDVEALSANPAALHPRGKRSFSFTHDAWIQSIEHEYLSLVFAASRGVWGLSFQFSQADRLERRTGPSEEPLGRFGVYEGAVGMAYARRWTSRLQVGAQVKLIRQAIASRTATGGAADLGLLYALGDRLRLGLAARNLGRMSELGQSATPLPRSVRLGLAYAASSRFSIGAEIQQVRDDGFSLHFGGEYAIVPRLVLRGGYQETEGRNLSVGLGLNAGNWTVDYAFIPFESGLGEAHRLSVQLHRPRR